MFMDDRALKETVISREVVFPGKIVRLEHWQVTLPNGETALREIACHPGAAAVVALDENDNLILVRQARVAVTASPLRFLPASWTAPRRIPSCAQSASCPKRRASTPRTGRS